MAIASPFILNEAVNCLVLLILFILTCFSEQSKHSVPIFQRGKYHDKSTHVFESK